MNRVIHKFALEPVGLQSVAINEGAQLLTAQMQHGLPQLWAWVDPSKPARLIHVSVVGTGHGFEDDDRWRYLSTIQLHGGSLVFHVFVERTPWLRDG